MSTIQFSVLHYYPSFISEECITVGILFHNLDTDERFFEITKNWDRVRNFDDEVNIDFMKDYLIGIRDEVVKELDNFEKTFDMRDYCRFYVNEYKFSSIQTYTDLINEDFIENTKKLFLKFDYEKHERLNRNEEKQYIRKLLKSNNIDYSSKRTSGKYNDSIKYDYMIDNYGIKLFTFEGKSLNHQISSAKHWAFNALSLKDKIKSVFIYDIERTDSEYFDTIIKILEEYSYEVFNLQEGFDFLLSLNKNTSLLDI